VVVLLVTVGIALVRRSGPSPAPIPSTSSPEQIPTPTGPPPPAAAATSDVFDGWSVAEGGGSTRFLETEDHHGGGAALLVVRPVGDTATSEPAITQTVTVAQDSRIVVSFWASSDGSSADGSVQVRLGGPNPASVSLPATAFGWTAFTAAWTVPAGVTSVPIAIAAVGATSGTRIDDVAVQGQGSRGVVVTNDGFEGTSAPVSISDASLVLQQSGALHLLSRLAPDGAFSWSAQEYTGGAGVTGRGRFSHGVAAIALSALPAGYYTFTLSVPLPDRTVKRSTNLVVTTAAPTGTTTPLLGVGVHLGAGDSQLTQKIGDLAALGIRAARTDADWASIEQQSGTYDFRGLDPVVAALQSAGIRPLLIPDYRNRLYDGGRTPSTPQGIAAYARFAAAVAARYPEADIDVYNEFDWRFNNGACGTTPQCYLQLLQPTAAAIKASGTSGSVSGPDIAGIGVQMNWLQSFIGGGGLDMVDALDFHPYVQPARPDVLDDQLTALDASLAAAGQGTKPVWFTEFGTSTASGWATERQQAEDIGRVFAVSAAHAVSRIYWYDAIDDGQDPSNLEHHFGLFRPPTYLAPTVFVPKPAAAALAATARLGSGRAMESSTAVGGLRIVRFAGAALAWTPEPDSTQTMKVHGGDRLYSMTGRPLPTHKSAQVGSSPIWNLGG
jgi:hypothetical protein